MSTMRTFVPSRFCCFGLLLALLSSSAVCAQTAAKKATEAPGTAEQRAARAYEAARGNPLELRAFLVRMPKGADLHYHLTGGIYAETFIREAAEDGLCVDLATHSFAKPAGAVISAARTAECAAMARFPPPRRLRTSISMMR